MNHITIELCAEDRARLDRLTEALEKKGQQVDEFIANGCSFGLISDTHLRPAKAPEKEAEPETLTNTHPVEEDLPWTTSEAEAPAKQVKPSITLAQIQQKVVQLCAGFGGKKKPQVREIISTYGEKVSDLKDQPEKWDEVWNKLTMLEIEEVTE